MNRTRLKVLLTKHEGCKDRPYEDTKGKLTIGVGRNLIDNGLRSCEIAFMLDNDINEVWAECQTIEGFTTLDDTRQHVIMDMVFTMGLGRFNKFVKLKTALSQRNFSAAADEILNSEWAKEAPNRAKEDAALMRGDA